MTVTARARPPQKRASAMPPDQRRAMIVRAALPLLVEHGEMATTKAIADAAGIAEGTIFRAFADKDALIAAVVAAALDLAPVEEAVGAIDPTQPLGAALEHAVVIMQERVRYSWRLFSALGSRYSNPSRRPPAEIKALVALFAAHHRQLRAEPAAAARLLRALTLAATHPLLLDEPLTPAEIVGLFLHGMQAEGAC